jgi:hypothetical protein
MMVNSRYRHVGQSEELPQGRKWFLVEIGEEDSIGIIGPDGNVDWRGILTWRKAARLAKAAGN